MKRQTFLVILFLLISVVGCGIFLYHEVKAVGSCPDTQVYCEGRGCDEPISNVGSSCSFPPGGQYTDQCGTCACPAGTVNCSNRCQAPATNSGQPCDAGQGPASGTYNTCGICQASAPRYVSRQYNFPGSAEEGYINIIGNIKSAGDVYLANGKAIRADGNGTTSLYIGNWGAGGQGVNVNVLGVLSVSEAISEAGQLLSDKYQAKGNYLISETDPKYIAWYAGGSPNISGNLTVQGKIKGNFIASDDTVCGANQILKRDTAGAAWVCGTDLQGSGGVGAETDPIYTAWYAAGSPTISGALTVAGSIKEGGSFLSAKYAGLNHNHDSVYSLLNHSHDNKYLSLNGGALVGNLYLNPGQLGIGTITPNKQLHIKTAPGNNAEIDIQSGAKGHWGIYQDETSEELRFWNDGNRLVLSKTGNLTLNGRLTVNGCFGPVFQQPSNSASTGSVGGYIGANGQCPVGMHVCSTNEILTSISCGEIFKPGKDTNAGQAMWISNLAPSLPTPTNDCGGWQASSSTSVGVVYTFNATGGAGGTSSCNNLLKFACCK